MRMRWKPAARWALALGMIGMGALHLKYPRPFQRTVPEYLPCPRELVLISGAFEIAGGAGLLVGATRKAAALGLVCLYVAVFPANINMAIHANRWVRPGREWMLVTRLPLQALPAFLAWALRE